MIPIIIALIGSAETIICAYLGYITNKSSKAQAEANKRAEERAELRAKEGKLQLAMINANCELTRGIANAMKNGYCNGDVEKGLEEMDKASKDYQIFLEKLAIEVVR